VFRDRTFCSINVGLENVLAVDKNNKGWGWGRNNYGQLGRNNTTCYSTPVAVCGNHNFLFNSIGWKKFY